ncbi:MAG: hypothetical protein EOS20_18575 [Mesorhizobium sp.]|uniref:hypothetical protein n=1 Tax=Mesorhizobium sp. TaxID=1871066 RepID=UPI000FE70D47|nr:hypothetical protein [Mesorhizobium sp.]RWQ35512.1 MAG: hypothetical protein EOS20_18575 [Mesorhizobium sp.]RWQ38710.1 MAG: hypothetical protein EOS21_19430 [Mesorhizobium sp.]
MQTLSKGDFAAHIGVTPGRVSQYISSGMIGPDALDGQGRTAKVIVAKAVEQIRRRRDIGQALGNGIATRLDLEPVEPDAPASSSTGQLPRTSNVDDELKQERLQAERRRNRIAAEDEALRRGQLVEAKQAAAETTKALLAQKAIFERMIPILASTIAEQFNLPERDVKHALNKSFSDQSRAAAELVRRRAAGLPEFVETIIEESAA